MSDLFSPMPLPDRPVLQTADIAAREAAAKQKEIDTRMRERLETGRVQSLHELGVAKETYQLGLQELERDYRREIATKPTRSYARGTSSRARTSYQNIQQNNDRVIVNQEGLRLSTQELSFKVDMRRAANDFIAGFRDSGMTTDEGHEAWGQIVVGLTDNLLFDTNPFVSSLNTTAQKKANTIIGNRTEWVTDQLYREEMKRNERTSEQTARLSFNSALASFVTEWDTEKDGAHGLSSPLQELEEWQFFSELNDDASGEGYIDSYRKLNSYLHREAEDAITRRLGAGAIAETSARMTVGVGRDDSSFTDYVTASMEVLESSELYQSLQTGENEALFGDISVDRIRGDMLSELGTVKANFEEEQKALKEQIDNEWFNGQLQQADQSQLYARMIRAGFTSTQALNRTMTLAEIQGNTGWNTISIMQAESQAEADTRKTWFSNALMQEIESNPGLFGDKQDLQKGLTDLHLQGLIDDPADLKWRKFYDDGMADKKAEFAYLYKRVSNFTNGLEHHFRKKNANLSDPVSLVYKEGIIDRDDADTINAFLKERLDKMIFEPGADGKFLSADGLEDWLKTQFIAYGNQFQWKSGGIGQKRTMPEELKGLVQFRGGEIPELQFQSVVALPGAEQGAAALFLDQKYEGIEGGDEARREFLGMDRGQQLQRAANEIGLRSYPGLYEADEAARTHNLGLLNQMKYEGAIASFRLEGTQAYIQWANNGAYVMRSLDGRGADFDWEYNRNNEMRWADLEYELEQSINAPGFHLTTYYQHPENGDVHEIALAPVTTCVSAANKQCVALAEYSDRINEGSVSIATFPPENTPWALDRSRP